MDVQVVLTQDDPKLGRRGEIVKVSSGHAQNFLFPNHKAKPATPDNLKVFQAEKERRTRQEAERRSSAESIAAKLREMSLTLEVAAGEGDKLYGAVTAQNIIEALSRQGISLDKKELHLEEPIRRLGAFQVAVKPHPEVSASLKVWVVKKK